MRIIAGKSKNQVLKTPKNDQVIRPALAQVREAIFSSLGDIEDFVFVDIFAGTGSLGFEALSRGASFVTFVDCHPQALTLLEQNAKHLGYQDQIRIVRRRMPHGLNKPLWKDHPDVIFCDPPYDKNLLNPTLLKLVKHVDPTSTVIIEHSPRELPETPGFKIIKEKRFGQTRITYLQKEGS